MKQIYLTVFFSCMLNALFAQNGWTPSSVEEFSRVIMEIEQAIPDNSSYGYETEYRFYEELESITPVMTDKAVLTCINGKEIYMEQFGKITVQNEAVMVTCDTVSGTIILNNAMADFTRRKSVSDFSALQTSGSLIQKKAAAGKTVFYIQFPNGFKYAGAEITLGGPIGVEQYILYSKETAFENMEGKDITAQPRMEVVYRNYTEGNRVNTKDMKRVSDFLALANGEYVPTDKYKDFELIDLRSQP